MRSLYKYLSDIFHTLSWQKVSLMMAGKLPALGQLPCHVSMHAAGLKDQKCLQVILQNIVQKKFVYVRKAKFIFQP